MGATKIIVIRHAEKPGSYGGVSYFGVDDVGSVSGDAGKEHLVTLGWERAGALVGLFAPPPRARDARAGDAAIPVRLRPGRPIR